MKGQTALEYLMTYGWMLLVVAIVAGAILATVSDQEVDTEPDFNKTQVMDLVERGAGQECEWESYNGSSGRIDCIQEIDWKNQTYLVHDYFRIEMVNGTVEITQ